MTEVHLHEIKRGWIMEYLVTAGIRPIPPRALLYHLRDVRCPTDWKGLNDHLTYLEQKGFVKLERAVPRGAEPVKESEIFLAVTLTAAGLDAYDQRAAGDTGFRI